MKIGKLTATQLHAFHTTAKRQQCDNMQQLQHHADATSFEQERQVVYVCVCVYVSVETAE